jgi:hypothetical protein
MHFEALSVASFLRIVLIGLDDPIVRFGVGFSLRRDKSWLGSNLKRNRSISLRLVANELEEHISLGLVVLW